MSSQHEKVAATLAELEAELAKLDELDADEKRKLTETLAELRGRLRDRTGSSSAEHATNSVARRLGLVAGRLESSHPTFSTNLAAFAGVLGQMGF
jgi:Domain of unknown function (DUF4404)